MARARWLPVVVISSASVALADGHHALERVLGLLVRFARLTSVLQLVAVLLHERPLERHVAARESGRGCAGRPGRSSRSASFGGGPQAQRPLRKTTPHFGQRASRPAFPGPGTDRHGAAHRAVRAGLRVWRCGVVFIAFSLGEGSQVQCNPRVRARNLPGINRPPD